MIGDIKAAETNNYPILLVFRPVSRVAPSGKYSNIHRSARLGYGPKPGAILGYLFISEALRPSTEDFLYRLCALANAAVRMNLESLRRLTKKENTQLKSIKLLEEYLIINNISNSQLIDTLRNINRLRQCYPVHGDRVEGVLEAHKYFEIDYPITDYSSAWKKLLNGYLKALQQLLYALKKVSK